MIILALLPKSLKLEIWGEVKYTVNEVNKMSLTVDGFENMIAGSLGIEEPWYICKCTVDNATQQWHGYRQ